MKINSSFLNNFLKELIRFRTVSNNQQEVRKALEYIKSMLSTENLEVNLLENEGVYSLIIKRGNPKVWLNTHIDVVPAEDNQFIPREDEKFIYGRGSSDAKAMVTIFISLLLDDLLKDKEFGVMIVGDEEIGGARGSRYLSSFIKPDILLIGEPSKNKNIALWHRGILWLRLKKKFAGGHGSRPYNNAYELTFRYLEKFFHKYGFRNIEGSLNTYNIAFANTNNKAFNKQPEDLEIGLDIRFYDEINLALFMAELVKKVEVSNDLETRDNLKRISFFDSAYAFFDEGIIEKYIAKKMNKNIA